jgi:hypothetical protein
MLENLSAFSDDAMPFVWLLLLAVVFFVWALSSYLRNKRLKRILQSVVGSFNQPLLFYDRRDRLVFYTSGLILFDGKSVNTIKRLDRRPPPDRELRGEMEIDSNTYRYRSRLLEYEPGVFGTIVFLEFHNSGIGRK